MVAPEGEEAKEEARVTDPPDPGLLKEVTIALPLMVWVPVAATE